jgi:hypothetical protein
MKARFLSVVATLGIAAGLVAVSATPASAGVSDCNLKSYLSLKGGYTCFEPNGDHIWLKDSASDSASVIVHYQTSYNRTGSCTNSAGGGTMKDCNFNFDEDGTIQLWMEVYDASAGKQLEESGWSGWVNI